MQEPHFDVAPSPWTAIVPLSSMVPELSEATHVKSLDMVPDMVPTPQPQLLGALDTPRQDTCLHD